MVASTGASAIGFSARRSGSSDYQLRRSQMADTEIIELSDDEKRVLAAAL